MVEIPTSSAKNAMEFDARGDRDWLNPIAMSKLQVAVKARKDEVVLNGIKFSITYGQMFTFPASGETRESVKLQRTDGQFVPFGYVPIKRILEFDFEKGE